LLKKKKFYENTLQNTDNQLDNLDQMVSSLEFQQMNIEVAKNIKLGNECLKTLNEMMTLDEIEDIMDDTREAMEHQQVQKTIFLLTFYD
jgi:charged multivesicular body protein 6